MKILEVNNIDLSGRRFNGYDFIDTLSNDRTIEILQTVILKQSKNEQVILLLKNNDLNLVHLQFQEFEDKELSIHSNLSLTTPALLELKEFQESDIIHFHMFHNTKLSLFSLIEFANKKKVILTLHDPWFLNGHCVHSQECTQWKSGCKECPDLNRLFSLNTDYSNELWKLKKKVFENIDIDLVVTSKWMLEMVHQSPITKNIENVHYIPFGVDTELFDAKYKQNQAKQYFGIEENEFVLFFRAQSEFKGTEYIVKALKTMNFPQKVALLTCSETGLLTELEDKYHIIELGNIDTNTLIYAYNACDLFLMPSIGESFGMMAIEAMACEKPVIVFNNSALPFVTHVPECGYGVENKNYEELKKAIMYLYEHPEERKKRGKLGRKIVIEEYGLEQYYQNIKNLYCFVLNRKQKKFQVKMNQEKKDDQSLENLKMKLNQLSEIIFKDRSLDYQKIMYSCKMSKKNYKIDYSNFYVQQLLDQYNKSVYQILLNKNEKKSWKKKLKDKVKKHPQIYVALKKIYSMK